MLPAAAFETVAGTLFLTTVIARLVGVYVGARAAEQGGDQRGDGGR